MAKLILRTSGFSLYFFVGLIALTSWLLISGIIASVMAFSSGETVIFCGVRVEEKDLTILPFAIIVFGWMIYQFIFYINSNKLILDDNSLTVSLYKKPKYPPRSIKDNLIPKKTTRKFNLTSIGSISIGTAKRFDKISGKNNDKDLKEKIMAEKERAMPLSAGKMVFFIPAWVGTKYTPYFYVRVKSGKSHLVTTKPFSKNGFRKFLACIKEKNIPIDIGDVNL